jgi:ABC-type uncharacterized transport system substrate-binding protein
VIHALERLQEAAPVLRVQLNLLAVRKPEEVDAAFTSALASRANGLLAVADGLFTGERKRILQLTAKHRLPAILGSELFVEDGGLMSYATDFRDLMRRAASHVVKILKGAKPGELPVEQATKFNLVTNMKTSRALGLTIPRSVLARADRVIE